MATRIRLEFEELKLDRPKKRWDLYFVVATPDPRDAKSDRWIATVCPEPAIPLRPKADNRLDFSPKGVGADGLIIFERAMPSTRSLPVRLWVMHSRRATRTAGSVMLEIGKELKAKPTGLAASVLKSAHPWWELGSALVGAGISKLGQALANVPDRSMGFVSLDENFGVEFEKEIELDRTNRLSTGFGEMTWTWSVVQ